MNAVNSVKSCKALNRNIIDVAKAIMLHLNGLRFFY
jgi:hypothetical protein